MVFAESFVSSLTILLPFVPTATMERVSKEGEVATANTMAWQFNSLPLSPGGPAKVCIYDLHTLQNRFYFKGGSLPKMLTAIPLLKAYIADNYIVPSNVVIAFPDEGACKRFGKMFPEHELVICGKKRKGDERIVAVIEGDCEGKQVIIVDDLVQSGGTLYSCKVALGEQGATGVDAFCTHAVFPNESWKRFLPNGDRSGFGRFIVTDSCPGRAAELQHQEPFVVLSLVDHFRQYL
eukprot:TRINITY_DN2116_c0_g1_i2.p1 TRINITY_DN2116_c0_g1~~TRINITY_DN2116_c0_g1_i2.p1  ORF type:complete len:236 (-),score=50.81 TRINITY_DN2116_c0_g1_i2:36-743(-)